MKLTSVETTFVEQQKRVSQAEHELLPDPGVEMQAVNLYPQAAGQTWLGFGGALTDASGYVYSLMDAGQRARLVDAYFNPANLNYTTVRIPIDSCDFSLGHYEAMSDPADAALASFSLQRPGQYIFPLLDDALRVCPRPLEIMLSPWSPPAFMKTNGERNHGGKLRPEYRQMWADYICRYVREFRARGYPVTRLTIQNEPKAVQRWDSCVYEAQDEKVFLRDFLFPTLRREGLTDTGIFIWDHNKERLVERAAEIIDPLTDPMIQGIAFHWYSGDHFEAVDLARRTFPGKILASTEACIEYYHYSASDYVPNAQRYAHEIIGDLNAGMQLFYDWNILLDELGGPNHVQNYCDAPFIYDTREKQLVERASLAYIWHFSHFIQPGAVRMETSCWTREIEAAAFANPDGSRVIVLLNRAARVMPVNLRVEGLCASLSLQPEAILTAVMG